MNKDSESKSCDPPSKDAEGRFFQNGEIVTAERLNEMIRAIESLKKRVEKLEKRGT